MIDLLDERLIELLEKDATRTSQSLSKELEVDSSTIRRRVQKLIKEGIIRIAAISDPDKIGDHFVALVAFDIAPEHLDSVLDFLSRRPEFRYLSATTGRFDAIGIVWFPSSNEYYSFIQKELAKLEGIKNTETFICLQVKKRSGMLTVQ